MNVATNIQKDIKELVENLGFQFLHSPTVVEQEGRYSVDIFVDEPRSLIGEKGANLRALQLVARLIMMKKYSSDIKMDVDVNGYKKKREEFIRDIAHQARRQALSQHGEVELEPMNPFDRRVIHTSLTAYNDVQTESRGEGFERRVVVSLAS